MTLREEDAFAFEVLYNPAWRRVVLIGTFAAVIAFLTGLAFELPDSSQRPLDRVAYTLAAVGLLALNFYFLFRPASLRAVTMLIICGGTFFIIKAAHLLFFALAMTDVPGEMTDTFFWVPILFVIAYLIPVLSLGRLSETCSSPSANSTSRTSSLCS